MNDKYYHYNKDLKQFARELRNQSTKAEVRLWCELLRQKKTGYAFLRQRPIANYIADFFCKELKLVIEVDGYSHQSEEKYRQDMIRQQEIEALGYHVLRFTDDEVMNGIYNVERCIMQWIEQNVEN